MVMNLAVNARDAMPDGGTLLFRLSREEHEQNVESANGCRLRLSVSDTGTGISPEVQAHLFEPFYTTKEQGRGTGLGLAQVHGIVKQHGGEIEVDSTEGQGSTFIIYLPSIDDEKSDLATNDHLNGLEMGSEQTILVVEDNPVLREAMSDTIETLGYVALCAGNGDEALVVLREQGEKVALVLTDLVMPVMGGEELLRTMREHGMSTPVVMLSGHPLDAEMDDLRAEGLAGWLLKPAEPENLAHLLAQTLAGSRRMDE